MASPSPTSFRLSHLPWRDIARTVEIPVIHGIAVLTLACILWLNILAWPIEWLGFYYNLGRDHVVWVEPGSAAAEADVQVGDKFLSIYGAPFSVVEYHPNLKQLIDRLSVIPITVERDGQQYLLSLERRPPSLKYLAQQAGALIMALSCWITGYILGIVRRSETKAFPAASLFWMVLGATLGAYSFANTLSLPLLISLHYILLTILVPLGVYMHTEFPRRYMGPRIEHRARQILIASVLLLTTCVATIIVTVVVASSIRPFKVLSVLLDATIFGMAVFFLISGMLFWREHRQTAIAHIKRQIQLLVIAYFVSTLAWLMTFILPMLLEQPGKGLSLYQNLVALPIPLAYIAVGVSPDLYRLDRLARILLSHLLAMLILIVSVGVLLRLTSISQLSSSLWVILICVLLYRPIQRLFYQLFSLKRLGPQRYQALGEAVNAIAASLDERKVLHICSTGLSKTFDDPPIAIYLIGPNQTAHFNLQQQYRLPHLPAQISGDQLRVTLATLRRIQISRYIALAVKDLPLSQDEVALLHHQGIVIWCPLLNVQQHLLGLIVLGQRPNLDPYRSEDLAALQSFVDSVGLALANSRAFYESQESSEVIRKLHHHLQQVQDNMAAAIAVELHDEIINVNVRLNLEAIDDILITLPPNAEQCRSALLLLRESEMNTAQSLRAVCEQLHPTGINDALGLPGVLRVEIQRLRSLWRSWNGELTFTATNEPLPLLPQQQLACLRITREAVTNALKHAGATRITVHLTYPTTAQGTVVLEVRDNGVWKSPLSLKPSHLGLRNMYEQANALAGELQLLPQHGTILRVHFPHVLPEHIVDVMTSLPSKG